MAKRSRRRRVRRKRILRKQPRRLTPPLFLKTTEGERAVLEVDQELITGQLMASTRTTALLLLWPGLRIQIGSRCINKRRIPVLRICPKDYIPPAWEPESPTFKDLAQQNPKPKPKRKNQ